MCERQAIVKYCRVQVPSTSARKALAAVRRRCSQLPPWPLIKRRARISPLNLTGGDVRRRRVDEVISHLIKSDLDVL